MEIPTLIYDGECPLCQRAQGWLAQRVDPAALAYLSCQSPERAAQVPQIAQAACMEAMHLVMPGGTIYVGEQAFPPLLRLVPGYHWLGRVLTWPGVCHVSPYVYRWIARHRLAISPLFARKAPGAACDLDGNCH